MQYPMYICIIKISYETIISFMMWLIFDVREYNNNYYYKK